MVSGGLAAWDRMIFAGTMPLSERYQWIAAVSSAAYVRENPGMTRSGDRRVNRREALVGTASRISRLRLTFLSGGGEKDAIFLRPR